MGRPPNRKKGPYTAAERQARYRKKLRRKARETKHAAKSAKVGVATGLPSPQSSRTKMRKYALFAEWKKYARGLLEEARSDVQSSVTYERWWATAVSAEARMDRDDATEMFRHLASALKIVVNMRRWPNGIVDSIG